MRRRLNAVLLAAGLCLSVFSMGVSAQETESEAVQQAVDEITQEESTLADEAETGTEDETAAETEALSEEEQLAAQLGSILSQVNGWTDEQIESLISGNDPSSAAIAANWKSVKSELGSFVEVTDAEMQMGDESISIVGHAKYDKIRDNTDVVVTYEMNTTTQTVTLNWEVNYPLGILMERAALNTVMGLGIVFLTLLFLSWLIGKLHYIPELIEKKSGPKEPAPAAPAAPAPAAAPAVVEEDLTDDLELVAVITAAIAASGTTSGDGFVVRSIKKANKRNWQRA